MNEQAKQFNYLQNVEQITLRDYFAAIAMQEYFKKFDGSKIPELSYAMADAMLKARGN